MSNGKKILITGATGFIGQHLLEQIVPDGFGIRVLSRSANPVFRSGINNLEIMQGDICDRETIRKAFSGVDIVVHLAAEILNSEKMHATNELALSLMVEEGRNNSISKFIHLSSVGVTGAQYSNSNLVINEQTVCNPLNAYEKSKLKAEKILLNSFWNENKQLTIFRPTNVYGEFHPREALLNLFRHVKNGKSIFASKQSQVNYLYVKDLTASIQYAINSNLKHNCYQVGNSIHLNDFIKCIGEAENVSPTIKSISSGALKFAAACSFILPSMKGRIRSLSNAVIFSDERLRNEFGYTSGYTKGINNSVMYYQKLGKL